MRAAPHFVPLWIHARRHGGIVDRVDWEECRKRDESHRTCGRDAVLRAHGFLGRCDAKSGSEATRGGTQEQRVAELIGIVGRGISKLPTSPYREQRSTNAYVTHDEVYQQRHRLLTAAVVCSGCRER